MPQPFLAPARRLRALPAFAFALAGVPAASAVELAPNLSLNGDVRLRYESDWDSHTAAGALRADRERGRLRLRAAATYRIDANWSLGARVRSGDNQSQQSPHLTFTSNDGPSDDLQFGLDRYFVQYKDGTFTGWAGRNSSPFWQQNELFWDEDITPAGVAGSFDSKQGTGTLTTTLGAFTLPDGLNHFNGQLFAGQLKYVLPAQPSQFTFAAGLHSFNGESGSRFLRNRNGQRDYLVGVLSGQWSTPLDGTPVAFGVDLFKNFQDYSAADAAPLAASNADETLGYVFSVLVGQLKQPRDWQLGYYYAHIETFATNASYAQDDWARFGSGPQSDLTDIQGHEFRVSYVITKDLNVMARLFLVEAITTIQDGKRFRLDLNWKF